MALYCKKKPFPGFGHPIMLTDPRVNFLLDLYGDAPIVQKAKALGMLITASYHIQANIDFAAAALMLRYGIPPVAGSAFFWFCRLPIIIGHICAKRRQPPFGLSSSAAREKYRDVPNVWL